MIAQVGDYLELLKYGAYAAILACFLIVIMDWHIMKTLNRQAKLIEELLSRMEAMERPTSESAQPQAPYPQPRRSTVPPGRSTGE
jgi:hypothetical protein